MRAHRLPSPGLGRVLLAALVLAVTLLVMASAASAASRNDPRIVNPDDGGVPVPWQVALVSPDASQDGLLPVFCGGTIRDAEHVITAAHCLEDTSTSDLYVIAGLVDRAQPEGTFQRRQLAAITSHTGYDPATTNNDLAILTLAQPLVLDGAMAGALPLVTPGSDDVGEWARISGWGDVAPGGPQADILLQADINVYPDAACGGYGAEYMPATMLCAGWTDGADYTVDTCQGDSGGPLARDDGGGDFTLIGVVSWGRGCADLAFPGIYTRLSNPELNARANDRNPPARIEPTARPVVSGSANVGQTLSCDGAAWTQQPLTTSYHWVTAVVGSDGRVTDDRIEGSGQALALDAGDLGRVVTCIAEVTSPGGAFAEQALVVGPIGGPLPPPPPPPAPPGPLAPPAPPAPRPPLPDRLDLERPNARYTRQSCARQRCRLTLVARDTGGPATSATATYQRLNGCKRGRRGASCRKPKTIAVKSLGGGVFEIATPKLAPARWRFTVVAVDAAGNRSKAVSVVLKVRRARRG